jgi:hypothetical protein
MCGPIWVPANEAFCVKTGQAGGYPASNEGFLVDPAAGGGSEYSDRFEQVAVADAAPIRQLTRPSSSVWSTTDLKLSMWTLTIIGCPDFRRCAGQFYPPAPA